MGVDREDARLRLDGEEQVEEHRLLLLEGAGEREAGVEALDEVAEQLLGLSASERSASASIDSTFVATPGRLANFITQANRQY